MVLDVFHLDFCQAFSLLKKSLCSVGPVVEASSVDIQPSCHHLFLRVLAKTAHKMASGYRALVLLILFLLAQKAWERDDGTPSAGGIALLQPLPTVALRCPATAILTTQRVKKKSPAQQRSFLVRREQRWHGTHIHEGLRFSPSGHF